MMTASEAVFILLGKAKPYALANIELATRSGAFDRVTVITDRPRHPQIRAVHFISANELISPDEHKDLEGKLTDLGVNIRWRNGYWIAVLTRFALLAAHCRNLDAKTAVVHFENDVASYLTRETLASLIGKAPSSVLAPFLDDSEVCPGIMYSDTPEPMARACQLVVDWVSNGRERSDMTALASMERLQLVNRLPIRADQGGGHFTILVGTELGMAQVTFDSLTVGQYLFGSDPRNSQGIRIPGFRYKRWIFDPGILTDWQIVDCDDGARRISARDEGVLIVFAELHVHAKMVLPDLRNTDAWDLLLAAANGTARSRVDFVWRDILYQLAFERLSPIKQRFKSRKNSKVRVGD